MKNKGFTLIEMMTVLIIIGIITAATLPYFFSFYTGQELKNSARIVASMLRTAKSYAAAQNVDYYILFAPSSNILEMTTYKGSVADGNEIGKKERLSLSAKIEFWNNDIAKDSTSFSDNAALFTPQGTSNGGAVTIKNTGKNKKIVISVLAANARVKIGDIEED